MGLTQEASKIQNAWLKAIEDGVHTYDIYREGVSKKKVGTKAFAQSVIDRLGESPTTLIPRSYHKMNPKKWNFKTLKDKKEFIGIDIFIHHLVQGSIEEFAQKIQVIETENLKLIELSSRGLTFWPKEKPLADVSDHWRCRFLSKKASSHLKREALDLMSKFEELKIDFIKTEGLYSFDGSPGFSGKS